MPAKSRKQQKFIFAKRSKYKTKKNTPKKWKWIWDEDWKKIENFNVVLFKKLFNEEIKHTIIK